MTNEKVHTYHPPSSFCIGSSTTQLNIIIAKHTFHHETFPTCNFFKLCDNLSVQLTLTQAKNARIIVGCSILQCQQLAWILP